MDADIELFAKFLKSIEVEYIVGIIGGGSTIRLVNALSKENIKFIHTHHEASASIIAGAINRSSNKKAISISIKGPGLINMLIGISFNNFERINSLSISEEYSDPVDSNKFHKRINQVDLLNQFTKSIYSYGYILKNKDEFILDINSENKRPIHISLSNEIYKKVNHFGLKSKVSKNLNLIIEKLRNSQKPVLIIGRSMLIKFNKIVKNSKIPIFSTVAGLGLIDSSNKYFAGVFTGEGGVNSVENNFISESDLLILFGVNANEVTGKLPIRSNVLSLDLINEYPEKPLFKKTEYFNEKIIKRILSCINHTWNQNEIIQAKQREKNTIFQEKWSPAFCFDFINEKIKCFNLILDTGNFAVIAEHIFKFDDESNKKYYGSSNSRFMGTSIPSAIGVSTANRQFPTICVVGDGGISPYISELKLINELRLPILILFISNGGYGSIDSKAPIDSLKDALYFNDPSWNQVVSAFGIQTFQCNNFDSYSEVVKKWDACSPLYIECTFEKLRYKLMTKGLR